mmetsp:Transcript_747/g.1880  ORF Transcript_747/g.1880 Transcript_747/m.1880 type:complete len:149 (-) Transcript_747:93-539(-)|eukprot:CAMPEP_0118864520 /NCGR_PEP_ID=MMETSP1163-20130328/9078_1 /TAXON_ID=124430 /ORGANISM="Phaeomonas parva, Strain CCMP2877" /LENGTH=148 /DNA_ID=CAMNT_0006798659 /DNA_START=226 /DNA_END=669 /DNA_ORIENTATION=-
MAAVCWRWPRGAVRTLARADAHGSCDSEALVLLSRQGLPLWTATPNELDVHGLTVPAARSALRAVLENQAGTDISFRGRLVRGRPLCVITGFRRGDALRAAVRRFLLDGLDPPMARVTDDALNPGVVRVPAEELERWLAAQHERQQET